MTATIKAFDQVHSCWLGIIHEAILSDKRSASMPYLMPIVDGYASVVWNNLCRSGDNHAVNDLILALIAQANRYRRNGLEVSAADCMFVVHKLKTGEMTVVSNNVL